MILTEREQLFALLIIAGELNLMAGYGRAPDVLGSDEWDERLATAAGRAAAAQQVLADLDDAMLYLMRDITDELAARELPDGEVELVALVLGACSALAFMFDRVFTYCPERLLTAADWVEYAVRTLEGVRSASTGPKPELRQLVEGLQKSVDAVKEAVAGTVCRRESQIPLTATEEE